jgi:hypothetical protein
MRTSGRRVFPRSEADAARRLARINEEIEQIVRVFPDLGVRVARPGRALEPPGERPRLPRVWRARTQHVH